MLYYTQQTLKIVCTHYMEEPVGYFKVSHEWNLLILPNSHQLGKLSKLCWTVIFPLFSSVKHKTVINVGIDIISVELNWCLIEMNKTVHNLQTCYSSASADFHTLYCKSCIWLIFSLFVHNHINQKYINNGNWETI